MVAHSDVAVLSPVSATPVVAVAGLLLLTAVLIVVLMSFVFHRRSGRR